MSIKIEDNVPVPSRITKYNFGEIKVGQSFLVKKEEVLNVRQSIVHYKRRHAEFNYTSRTQEDESVRFWRTEVKAGL